MFLHKFMIKKLLILSAFTLSFQANCHAFDFGFSKQKRDHIYIVGSSTISPLMAAVSEEFSRQKALAGKPIKTPLVESSGTVAGFKLFCAGVAMQYPDFANASRMISEDEKNTCYKNGVNKILEIKIGYDGIVIATSKTNKKAQSFNLSKEQIFKALAEKIYDQKSASLIKNPYKYWSEIDKKLPHQEIIFFGPPSSSGTRDVFVDMIMEEYCMHQKEVANLFANHDQLKQQCHKIRDDGVFISSGENDDNIMRALTHNPQAFGIFGFNYLVANSNKIQPIKIANVTPNQATISSKEYSLSRPLFVYFKGENLNLFPEMRDFINELISHETIGKNGYLFHSGLVPLSDGELAQLHKIVLSQIK